MNKVTNTSSKTSTRMSEAEEEENQEVFEIKETKEVEVFREIAKINIIKSSGFDTINSRVIKEAFKATTPQLTKILNMSIQTGLFPQQWKLATVIPIPKTGDLSKVENYRPISLLPLPGKILEKLIHEQVEANLEKANFFTKYQHGFRKNHSTIHATLQLINQINHNIDKGIPTAAIFIDFREAFDCVNHRALIDKVRSTNLGPKTCTWIENYLSDRQQQVLVNGVRSEKLVIRQGVPQGSTLGPLYYIIYANDIPQMLENGAALYADDTVLYTKTNNLAKIEKGLQKDMDSLAKWCYDNKLTFNTGKTKLMVFGNKKARDKLGSMEIRFEGRRIEEATAYNYLGIKLDQTLSYDLHVKSLIQRVSDKITHLRKIRRFKNNKAALSIYKNMILPILEYGDILLISAKKVARTRLQTLQNKALKCALGLDSLTDTNEVHKLAKLEKLHVRRKQHMLQLMYKQLENTLLWQRKTSRTSRTSGVATRSSKKKSFVMRKTKTEKYKKSITVTAPNHWNALPQKVQAIKDPHTFKRALKQHFVLRKKGKGEEKPKDQ